MGAKKFPINMKTPAQLLIGRDLSLIDMPEHEVESMWVEFRAAYPKRVGGQNVPEARKVFYEWVYKHQISPERMVAGAKGFAEYARSSNIENTRFVPHMVTFLRQSRYEVFAPADDSTDKATRVDAIVSMIKGTK